MRKTIAEIMRDVSVKPGTKPKKIANNTMMYTAPDDSVRYRLHRTDVVIKYPNGIVELNSGGYKGYTTKDRINSCAPIARLYQKDFEWFVSIVKDNGFHADLEFYDGMKIGPDGRLVEG